VKRIDATSDEPVKADVSGVTRSAGRGAPSGKAKGRGSAGQVVIENEDTGEIKVFSFRAAKGSTGTVHKFTIE
jgi:hypothetical protein